MSDEYEDEQELEQKSQAVIPAEQDTLTFHGKPLIVVRLPDGRAGVVLRWLCENLNLTSENQIRRIRRTEVIADDLVYVQVQTDGGPQNMATLVLHGVAYWLATIDTRRMDKADPRRAEILAYQRDAVDALYAWASTPRAIAAPTKLVPSEPVTEPARPGPDASNDDWIIYHQQMLQVLEWRRDIEQWRGGVETRLEGLEAMTDLIPEILERLGPEKITPEHQNMVKHYVEQLMKATGKPRGTIYSNLYTAFNVPRYQEIPEDEWPQVERWFKGQIERGRNK
ncbi:MAG: phage antirepressor N-terminal domain-containing protein [Ktedonobacteraceae bacterium]